MLYGWCDLRVDQWDELSTIGWEALPVCGEPQYLNGQPSAAGLGIDSPGYMKDMPFMAAVGTGARSDNTVMFATGQFVFTKTFLIVPSIGSFTWRFGLNFLQDSKVGKTSFGNQFNFAQNVYLKVGGFFGGSIEIFTGEDSPLEFESIGSFDGGDHTVFRPGSDSSSSRSILIRDNTAVWNGKKYYLLSHDGTKTYFSNFTGIPEIEIYHIQSIVDRHGNTQKYDWKFSAPSPKINTVTDPYGRVAKYQYDGSDPYLVTSITDPIGRRLHFQYDDNDNLLAIILPAIKNAAGRKYSLGTAYVFEYDDEDRMRRIFYPDQANTGLYVESGVPKVNTDRVYKLPDSKARNVVTYYAAKYEGISRVRNEQVGPKRYSFDYEDPSDMGVWHTDVTDRNGFRTRYKFSSFNRKQAGETILYTSDKNKNSLQKGPYRTFIEYDKTRQPIRIVFPNNKKIEKNINDGKVSGLPLGDDGIDWRQLGAVQESIVYSHFDYDDILRTVYVYEPLYNQVIATVDPRAYSLSYSETKLFAPQLGPGIRRQTSYAPAYATGYYYDFQDRTYSQIKASSQVRIGLFEYLSDEHYDTALESLFNSTRGKWLRNTADLSPDDYLPAPAGRGRDKCIPAEQDGPLNGNTRESYNGNLIQVRYPVATNRTEKGPQRSASQKRIESFTYNAAGQMTTATDAEGNVTAILRYTRANPANQEKIQSSILDLLPDLLKDFYKERYGYVAAVYADVDPRRVPALVGGGDADMPGFRLVTQRGGSSQPGKNYVSITTRYDRLDELGNPTRVIDPRGQLTTIDRTELGEPYRITGPKQGNNQSGTIEFQYSANRNLIRRDIQDLIVNADGERVEITGSSNDNLSLETKNGPGGNKRPGWFVDEYTYDILDNLTRQDAEATDPDRPRNAITLTTRYRYDGNENLILVVSPEGNTIELDYDERNLLLAERAGNRWTGGGRDFSPNLIEQVSDEDGKPIAALTTYTYDANGNLTLVLGPRLGSTYRNLLGEGVMTISQAFGQTVRNSSRFDRNIRVPENAVPYLMRYDGFDRLVAELSQPGYLTVYQYDPISNVIRSRHFEEYDFSRISNLAFGAIPASNQLVQLAETINRFDEQGRVYEQQESVSVPSNRRDLLGSATQEMGSLQPLNWKDNHESVNLQTGQIGPLIPQVADLKSGQVSRTLSASTFDRAGRVHKAWADNGSFTEILYDGVSRTILEKDVLGNAAVYIYDPSSNVVATRMVEVHPANPKIFETFSSRTWYDLVNRPVLTAAQGPKAGQLNEDRNALPEDAITMRFGYDSRGNLTHAMDPKGNTAQTQYDAASRPLRVLQQLRKNGLGSAAVQATILTQTEYDLNSRVTKLLDANNNATSYGYDSLDRATSLVYADGSQERYRYNSASDLIGHTDPNGSGFKYKIDDLGRVTNVLLSQKTGNPHILAPTKNANGTSTDPDGVELQAFAYDGLSRLTYTRDSTVEPGQSNTAGKTTDFTHDGARVCEEREPNLSAGGERTRTDRFLLRQYVWGQYVDELIQQREYRPGDVLDYEDLYPLCDLHYRTASLATSTGDIIETYDYDAYGNTLIFPCKGPDGCTTWQTTDNQTVPDPLCNYLYQGRYLDPETGLYDFRARGYHPELGIFLQRDPLGYVDGMNLYQFEDGMPTDLVDPDGTLAFIPILVYAGLAIATASTASYVYNVNRTQSAFYSGDLESARRYQSYSSWSLTGVTVGLGLVVAPLAVFVPGGFAGAAAYVVGEGAVFGFAEGAANSYAAGDPFSEIGVSAFTGAAAGALTGILFAGAGGLARRLMPRRLGLRKLHNTKFGNIKDYGVYNSDGSIVMRRRKAWGYGSDGNVKRVTMGRTKQEFGEDLVHELTHRSMNRGAKSLIQIANDHLWYRSHLLTYLDEFIPEAYATKSISKAHKHALNPGYRVGKYDIPVNWSSVKAEAANYAIGTVFAAGLGAAWSYSYQNSKY